MNEQSNKLFFLVEDDPDQVKLLKYFLSEEGFQFVIATSGKEALSLAQKMMSAQRKLDLLLLDYNLPDQTGLELLTTMKQTLPSWSSIPCVFLTGVSDPSVVHDAYKHGAFEYLTKPLTQEVLHALLQTTLRR